MTLPNLRDLLDSHFNDAELRGLCFDLGIDYEHLRGDNRLAKAQALVEHCLRHGRLPDLLPRCRELRPKVDWPDVAPLLLEWDKVQQGIAAQAGLQGLVPDEQIAALLAALRQKEADLLAQLGGSGVIVQGDGTLTVSGDNNHIQHIVHIYREGGGQVSAERLSRAIADYADWVAAYYGRIPLRGLSDREYNLPDPELPTVYVSLAAQREAGRWQEQEQKALDMGSLLGQGHRLVITGGPGSGKTTFLRYVAYLLARAIHTGDETAVRQHLNLQGPLPLPIYLSLADFYRYRQQHGDGTLIDFSGYTLIQQHGVFGLPPDFFAQMLAQANTLCLLLDSLDEIPDEEGRFQVSTAVLQLAANRSVSQMLVASRDHAYSGRVMLPRPFRRFIVQPMQPEQVDALARRWCRAVYPPPQADEQTRALQNEIKELEAIRKAQGEAPLVETPLLVTIVAIVHYNERKLPQQRAALYEKCVNALLAEQYRAEEGQGQSQADLERRGGSTDVKRGYLALLAFEMMRSGGAGDSASGGGKAGRTADLAQMAAWLLPEFRRQGGADAAPALFAAFRQAMCDRASILHERAGQVEFTHLTFQEFLCAYHLAVNESPAEIAAFFRAEGRLRQSWWREAILLTIGYLGKTAVPKCLNLVGALLADGTVTAAALAAVELATSGLLELEIAAPDVRSRAVERLVALLTDANLDAPPPLRAAAGRALSKLGDPRPGVGVVVRDGVKLPDIAWGEEVPAGMYTIGEVKPVTIAYPYRLSCYPITYAQFQCFVDAPDVGDGRWWDGVPASERKWGEQAFPFANHPRERVSWYQAVAFCRWLSDKLGVTVELPHEYEWEVAARWPDNRFYPWGNDFDKAKANTREGGVGQTTAVGIYPAGKNEALNLYDLSGNVWEWCRDKYDNPNDEAIDQGGSRRVLRGGSWSGNRGHARAAARYNLTPDSRYGYVGLRLVVARRPPSLDH